MATFTISPYTLCWGGDRAAKINVPERVPEQEHDNDTDYETQKIKDGHSNVKNTT